MQQHQMQPHMGSYPAHNVTTEIIQKYLDENKQLILAILDNQNLGKMNECAAYQAKLQANLMYLAAIADSQPQAPPVHPQVPPAAVMPHYMAHQQAQQQMAQQQALMAARNPLQYTQTSISSMHHGGQQHQQHSMSAHHGMNAGGNIGMHSGAGLGGNIGSGGYPDFPRAGTGEEDLQMNRGLGVHMPGSKSDGPTGDGHGGGQNAEEPEASYLKASEEEGN